MIDDLRQTLRRRSELGAIMKIDKLTLVTVFDHTERLEAHFFDVLMFGTKNAIGFHSGSPSEQWPNTRLLEGTVGPTFSVQLLWINCVP
jgi:hypothetical protein